MGWVLVCHYQQQEKRRGKRGKPSEALERNMVVEAKEAWYEENWGKEWVYSSNNFG